MRHLSYTKSRCLNNTPAPVGVRRRHLQGVPYQLLTFQHVKWFHTTVRPCIAEMMSGCDEDVLILQRSAYHLCIQEEINYKFLLITPT